MRPFSEKQLGMMGSTRSCGAITVSPPGGLFVAGLVLEKWSSRAKLQEPDATQSVSKYSCVFRDASA
jgi:hypothetical protein